MKRVSNGSLLNFVPSVYWELFCDGNHIDISNYPYLKWDYDPSTKNTELFAIFDFRREMINGMETSKVIITYKAINSKSNYDVIVYLG